MVAALQGLSLFADVLDGVPDRFGGKSPIAVVRSRSFEAIRNARGLDTNRYGIDVTLYVSEKTGTPSQVEAALDALVEVIVPLLMDLQPEGDDTNITAGPSAPPDGDVLQRTVDGHIYRAERIPVTWDAEAS